MITSIYTAEINSIQEKEYCPIMKLASNKELDIIMKVFFRKKSLRFNVCIFIMPPATAPILKCKSPNEPNITTNPKNWHYNVSFIRKT